MKKDNKIKVILDTNFIIAKKDILPIVLNKLSKNAEIYLPRVVIDERLAQQYGEIRDKSLELEKVKNNIKDIITLENEIDVETVYKSRKETIDALYEKFVENIIEYDTSRETFQEILYRAYNKIPPFVKGGSDRGLKDTLLWLSIIKFFKNMTVDGQIVLLTDDKGFLKTNGAIMEEEFKLKTGKDIKIHDNSYYLDLVGENKLPKGSSGGKLSQEDIDVLKDKIQNVLADFCYTIEYDDWGRSCKIINFETFDRYTTETLLVDLKNFSKILEDHIFDNNIGVEKVLKRAKIGSKIPIASVRELNNLFMEFESKYSDYLNRFLISAVDFINENNYDDNSLPF